MKRWESAGEFRKWMIAELDEREWRPVDLARRMQPDNPASMASSISKWIRGVRQPDPASCERLALILGADPDYVLELAGHRASISGALARDDARAKIAAMIATMPGEEIGRIELIIRAIHDQTMRDEAAKTAASKSPR